MNLEFLIETFSYFGFFLSGLISSSTIFFPVPIYFVIAFADKFGFNPIIVALLTALGASIGEITSYLVGAGTSFYAWKKIRKSKNYKIAVNFFKKYGGLAIILFAITPLPFDVIGILCGFLRYDIKKFLIITFIGKLIQMFIIILLGEVAINYLGW
ncbi:MAG: VTT domain-containing protein [Candidatus Aenigmatarchaeota archaeon]